MTLAQGSTVNGIVRTTPLATINEPCHGIGPNYPITITFGLEYSALLGPSAPLCIARSKLSFTQFEVSGSVFNSAWNPTVRSKVQGQVHMDLDERVITELSTPSPGASPRCANWQELP